MSAGAQTKPNILIIFGDDIGQFNVSTYNMGMMGYLRFYSPTEAFFNMTWKPDDIVGLN